MAGLPDFYAGIQAVLESDSGIDGWAMTHFGRSLTVLGPLNVGQATEAESPAAMIEIAPLSAAYVVLAEGRVRRSAELEVFIAWAEEDPAKMLTQRLALPDLVVNAVAKDPTIGNVVESTEVVELAWDEDANGVKALLIATIRGSYDLEVP